MKLLIVLIFLFSLFCYSQKNYNTEKFEYISPVPGSNLQLPSTNIIIRFGEAFNNLNINDTSIIDAEGDISGHHSGSLYLTKDSKTIVFEPFAPFLKGELVTVQLSGGLRTISNTSVDSLGFFFHISKVIPFSRNSENFSKNNIIIKKKKKPSAELQSPNDSTLLFPSDFPKIFIKNMNEEDGTYFLGINQSSNNYLAVISSMGIPIYYKRSSNIIYDFKMQPSGILTYYDLGSSKFYAMDSLFQVVDSFYCKNGYATNFHDLQVLPDGHSFLISLDPQQINMDTVKPGTDSAAVLIGNVIQEIDENKVVVWQWRTWDNFKITDADSSFVDFYQHTIEYSHINSIDVVDENKIIFSVRNFNEITEVNRNTGKVIWRLGGYNNQFKFNLNNSEFELQHDARLVDGNKLSVFDNQNIRKDQKSRVLIFNIDEQKKTVGLANEISHTPDISSKNMGNVQYTPNGNYIVGWGNTGRNIYYMSVIDKNGNTISNDSLMSRSFIYSYKAFKFPWKNKIISSDKDSLLFDYSLQADSIYIKNNSLIPIDIGGVFYKNPSFSITDTFPINIPPGKKIHLHFKFQNTGAQETRDTAYVAAYKGNEMASIPINLIGNPATFIEGTKSKIPDGFSLTQNYPNPFNPSTTFSYSLPSESRVRIGIYNIIGKEIKILADKIQSAGKYNIKWDGSTFTSGVYFCRMSAVTADGKKQYTAAKKMILMK